MKIVEAKKNLPAKGKEINPKDYETKLNPEDEKKFQSWLDKNHKEGKIAHGDYRFYKEKGYGYNYDFRAAYKDNEKSEVNTVDKQWHWGDVGKKPNHPTFSNQSKYYPKAAAPGVGGYWKGEQYIKNPKIGPPIPPTKE